MVVSCDPGFLVLRIHQTLSAEYIYIYIYINDI